MELRSINKEICITIRTIQKELKSCVNELNDYENKANYTQARVNELEKQLENKPTKENEKMLCKAYDAHDIAMYNYDNALEYIEHLTEVLDGLQTANKALVNIM